MTTLKPRKPYSDAELKQLYPPSVELQLVQILMRHGERTPVSARFKDTGLAPYWNYCRSSPYFSCDDKEPPNKRTSDPQV